MKPVIQQEVTGCGIACSAAIAGISYSKAKQVANSLGIYADDDSLWSDTKSVRKILKALGIKVSPGKSLFKSWESLPDCALLSIKWRLHKGKPYWHWVVYVRENGDAYVLDSRKGLLTNVRTDFGRMKPKWFLQVSI